MPGKSYPLHVLISVAYNCNQYVSMLHEACGSKLALCKCCEGLCFAVDFPSANLDLRARSEHSAPN